MRDSHKINDLLIRYYEFPLNIVTKISNKAYIASSDDKKYFVKNCAVSADFKYKFLADMGLDNILYPKLNYENNYVSKNKHDGYYITDYIEENKILTDIMVQKLLVSLDKLHSQTVIPKQLSVQQLRPKFDKISSNLDIKFKIIENYIRSIEHKTLNKVFFKILASYQHLLDAKKELVRLQKRIISHIKDREKVSYVFVHNRPTNDHLLNVKGLNYLTSLEYGKIGINSLDVAKVYVEYEELDIDYEQLIVKNFFNQENSFYYDYFRFLVLYIFINKLVISYNYEIAKDSIIEISEKIKRYFLRFSDNNEQVTNDDDS